MKFFKIYYIIFNSIWIFFYLNLVVYTFIVGHQNLFFFFFFNRKKKRMGTGFVWHKWWPRWIQASTYWIYTPPWRSLSLSLLSISLSFLLSLLSLSLSLSLYFTSLSPLSPLSLLYVNEARGRQKNVALGPIAFVRKPYIFYEVK